jgi:hypothetical protein
MSLFLNSTATMNLEPPSGKRPCNAENPSDQLMLREEAGLAA